VPDFTGAGCLRVLKAAWLLVAIAFSDQVPKYSLFELQATIPQDFPSSPIFNPDRLFLPAEEKDPSQ
jgi:hypothetical protein